MRHQAQYPIAKITKLIRQLAAEAYDIDGRLRSSHMGHNGKGLFRAVIIRDGVAFKLARNSDNSAHNRREWEIWKTLPDTVRAITAKPLAISNCGRIMAMELVSGGTLADNYDDYHQKGCKLDGFNKKLRTLLADAGFDKDRVRRLTSDNHGNNIALRANGELCWIDFAACQ